MDKRAFIEKLIMMYPSQFIDTETCDDWIKEYENVLDAKLDGKKLILDELELIKNSGMPKNYGLGENNILYRKHNDEKMIKIDEEWWQMVSNYAKRDQLSFAYLLWKNGINIKESTFENSRLQTEHFYVFAHKKGRS